MEIKKISDYRVIYYFCINIDELEKTLSYNYNIIKHKINFKGFRKGHVPIKVFQKFFNTDYLYNKVFEDLITQKYQEILKDKKMEIIGQPELIDLKPYPLDFTQPLSFGLDVNLVPKIDLCKYKGLEIIKKNFNIEEEVEKKIKQLLEQQYIFEDKKSNLLLELSDIAVFDFEGFINKKTFEGNRAENFYLEIGSGKFIPGFEESMIGMKIQEKKEINVTFPSDYHLQNLVNKKAIFNVCLKAIKIKKPVILSNKVVKKMNFKNVENIFELKKNIKKNLEIENNFKEQKYFKEQILNHIINNSYVDISRYFLDKIKEQEIENLKRKIMQEKITLEQYFISLNISQEKFEKNIEEKILNEFKWKILLKKIIEQEKLTVFETEVEQIKQEINKVDNKNIQVNKNNFSSSRIKSYLLEEKVFNFIISKAIIKNRY
ncbi:trigger factor [Candidatus Phytoplasma prunorum]|uniref:trigger factor n=1 Tax=Candidatus Phytoplasma prunorum TaxID=47565 RepID=UPI002FEE6FB2